MSDLNKTLAIGRLGQDPEVRYTKDGKAVAGFSIACSEKWKAKDGSKQESTEWINCTAFGRLGEIVGEYLRKGSQVFIEGKLKTEKWQDKNGNDHYTTKVIVSNLQMLGSGGGTSTSKAQGGEPSPQPAPNNAPSSNAGDDFSDDIPFAPLGKEYIA